MPQDQRVVQSERHQPCQPDDRRPERSAPASSPAFDEQDCRARGSHEQCTVAKPHADAGDRPPDSHATRQLVRAIRPQVRRSIQCPRAQRGQQQRPERVGGIVLELQRKKYEPLSHRAEQCQDGGTNRTHPASADPDGSHQRANPEEHVHHSNRTLAAAEREQHEALQRQPPEWRALIEPERAGKATERMIANVEQDHLLVDPQGPGGPVPVNQHRGADECRQRRDPVSGPPGNLSPATQTLCHEPQLAPGAPTSTSSQQLPTRCIVSTSRVAVHHLRGFVIHPVPELWRESPVERLPGTPIENIPSLCQHARERR